MDQDEQLCVLASPTVLAAEVRQSHILQRDLLQEAGTLAARVAGHDLAAPQPIAEPGQAAVAVERVCQEVPGRKGCDKRFVNAMKEGKRTAGVSNVCQGLTGWRGSAGCRRLRE